MKMVVTKERKKGKVYNYIAYDESGTRYAGLIEASSEKEAERILKGGGYRNIRIKELSKWQYNLISIFVKLSYQEVMLFTRQVAEMLKAGFPIARLLDVIALSTSNKKLALICLVIKENLKSGNAISTALQRYTDIFNPVYIGLVRIGEKTGQLFDVMEELAKYLEEEHKVRSKLISSLIYPIFVILITFLIVWGLIVFIFPKLFEILQGFEVSIPLLTQVLLKISEILSNPLVLGLGFSAIFITSLFFKFFAELSPQYKILVEKIIFSIPYVGYIMFKIYELRFARALLLVLRSGMSFLEGMRNLEQSFDSGIMKDIAIRLQRYLKEGEYLTTSLYKIKFFSPFFIDMIKTGEETGELETMLNKICQNLEFEIKTKIEALLSMFEPALVVF
ncbi:MAG: type II secretion system F family protein, partial [Candidatus Calescibacterium sp.]|nr:type II secretion system F family protein [Candidatus Calescibacterium sp.]